MGWCVVSLLVWLWAASHMERGVDNMEVLEKVLDFMEEHPCASAFALIAFGVGYIIDERNKKGDE